MQVSLDDKAVKTIIDEHIKLAIAQALGKNPDALISNVVNAALNQKANSYDRETIFQKSINDMITKTAKDVFQEWLDSQKEKIRIAVLKRLKQDASKFVDSVADQLINGLSNGFYCSINMKVGE